MEFNFFDSSDCGFPKPKVPVLPALTRHSLNQNLLPTQATRRHGQGAFKALRKGIQAKDYARGRYALFEAYRSVGVGKSGALLAPSYHCRTMIDPALRLQAKVEFYPLKPDLSPDIEAIRERVQSPRQSIKALLATHYFGFPQELAALAGLCEQYDIALIEDCSHALFTPGEDAALSTQKAVGETGRFVIASPYKFYPCEDGGLLWRNDGSAFSVQPQHAASPLAEIRGALGAISRSRANALELDRSSIGSEIEAMAARGKCLGRDIRNSDEHISIFYRPAEEQQRSLAVSRWICRHTSLTRLTGARRENYRFWLEAVAGIPACRALFPILEPDCVPYMFPLLIESPRRHFHLLKLLALPVWRWDQMAISDCDVAATYRLNLLHLPCHQELTLTQMDWMAQVVRQVLTFRGSAE